MIAIDFYEIYIQYHQIIKAILILIIGLTSSRIISIILERVIKSKFGSHIGRITKNITFYIIALSTIFAVLGLFEINLTGVLAAAGILGIAIGFAAQTSVSNIISGFFLMADKPFEIGEAIEIDGLGGHVIDISLLSTRLRTFDNRYLRFPNSAVMNAKIVNLSRYDIRRLDIIVGIAYKENIQKALDILTPLIKYHPKVLMEPEPLIIVTKFGDSSIDFEIRVWVQRIMLFSAKSEIITEIKKAFDNAGIEIPFPHRTLYFGNSEKSEKMGKTPLP